MNIWIFNHHALTPDMSGGTRHYDFAKELIKRGYGDKIVLSMDITRKSHFKKNGGLGYSHLLDTFVPMMEKAGISKADINKMLITNPENIFS